MNQMGIYAVGGEYSHLKSSWNGKPFYNFSLARNGFHHSIELANAKIISKQLGLWFFRKPKQNARLALHCLCSYAWLYRICPDLMNNYKIQVWYDSL